MDLLLEERLGVAMVSFSQSEDVVESLMKLPYVNACTDALLGGRPHPRAFGTYPRILGRYVRDRKALPLEAAVRKLSGLAADAFRFDDHGYLAAGKRANVVLFDPAGVRDTATFEGAHAVPGGHPLRHRRRRAGGGGRAGHREARGQGAARAPVRSARAALALS